MNNLILNNHVNEIFSEVAIPNSDYVDPLNVNVNGTDNMLNYKYRVLHFNIRGLASNLDK